MILPGPANRCGLCPLPFPHWGARRWIPPATPVWQRRACAASSPELRRRRMHPRAVLPLLCQTHFSWLLVFWFGGPAGSLQVFSPPSRNRSGTPELPAQLIHRIRPGILREVQCPIRSGIPVLPGCCARRLRSASLRDSQIRNQSGKCR